MDGEFFVQIVEPDGNGLGKLFGPCSWDEAVVKVKAYHAFIGPEPGVSDDVLQKCFDDGAYSWENGGGIYTLMAEPIDAPFFNAP